MTNFEQILHAKQDGSTPFFFHFREASIVEDSEEAMEVDGEVSSGLSTPLVSSAKHPKHDLMIDENKTRQTFFKETKTYPMYPCREDKLKWDEYGEAIRYRPTVSDPRL